MAEHTLAHAREHTFVQKAESIPYTIDIVHIQTCEHLPEIATQMARWPFGLRRYSILFHRQALHAYTVLGA